MYRPVASVNRTVSKTGLKRSSRSVSFSGRLTDIYCANNSIVPGRVDVLSLGFVGIPSVNLDADNSSNYLSNIRRRKFTRSGNLVLDPRNARETGKFRYLTRAMRPAADGSVATTRGNVSRKHGIKFCSSESRVSDEIMRGYSASAAGPLADETRGATDRGFISHAEKIKKYIKNKE